MNEIAAQTPRYEMVVLLLASGRFSVEQIANALCLDIELVEGVCDNPVSAQAINTLRAYMPTDGDAAAILANDAEANMQWMRNLRDGHIKDDAKMLQVRLNAAKTLAERQVAKKVDAPDTRPPARDVTPEQTERMTKLLTGKVGSHAT